MDALKTKSTTKRKDSHMINVTDNTLSYSSDNDCPSAEESSSYASTTGTTSSTYSNNNDLIAKLSNTSLLGRAKTSCPAFKGGTACPFSDVLKKEVSMEKVLKDLPPSHIEIVEGSVLSSSSSNFSSYDNDSDGNNNNNGTRSRSGSGSSSLSLSDSTMMQALQKVHSGISSSSFLSPDDEDSSYDGEVDMLAVMEQCSLPNIIAKLLAKSKPISSSSHLPASTTQSPQSPTITIPFEPLSSTTTEQLATTRSRLRSSSITSLSEALKTGTAESHSAAHSVHFIKNFIKGNIDRHLYGLFIIDLHYVYTTLEHQLREYAPKLFPTLHFPFQLERTLTLADDVDYFHGDTNIPEPSEQAKDYVKRLNYIAKKEPLLLLSHAYTRYLGDLSGGTILAKRARMALNLSKDSNDGLNFYYFEHISNPIKFKDEYRSALDQLLGSNNLNDNLEKMERLVAEANVAFVLNMRLFERLDVLDGGIKNVKVRDISEATFYYDKCLLRQKEAKFRREETLFAKMMTTKDGGGEGGGECPFGFVGPNPHGTSAGSSDNGTTQKKLEQKGIRNDDEGKHSSSFSSKTLEKEKIGRCPWPFVFFHDPMTGMKDYQTWIVLAIVCSWMWNCASSSLR